MKNTILLSIIGLFVPLLLQGQYVYIDTLLDNANEAYKQGSLETAIKKAKIGQDVAFKKEYWKGYYKAGHITLKAFKKQGRYDEALDSIEAWLDHIPADDRSSIGKLLYHRGMIYKGQDRFYSSILAFQRALPHMISVADEVRVFGLYKNISNCYGRIQDSKASRSYAFLALDHIPSDPRYAYNQDVLSFQIAESYSWEGNHAEALRHLQDYASRSEPLSTEGLGLLSKLYILNGDTIKAKSILAKVSSPEENTYLSVLEAQKALEEQRKNIPKVIKYQNKICEKTPRKYTNREYYRELVKLAGYHYQNKDFTTCNSILDSVFHYYSIRINNTPDIELSQIRRANFWLAVALYLKGKMLWESQDSNPNKSHSKTLACIEAAMKILRKEKQYVVSNNEKYRLGIIEKKYSLLVIEILRKAWNKDRDKHIFEKAFSLSQLTNAAVLKASQGTDEILDYCTIPNELKNQWLISKETLSNARLDTLAKELMRHDSLENEIRSICPVYDHVRDQPVAVIEDILENLRAEDYLIKYQKQDSKYHFFFVGADTLIWDVLKEGDLIDSLVTTVYDILSEGKEDQDAERQYIHCANTLYKILIQPYLPVDSRETQSTLYIVPDGKLRILPFDALIAKPTSSWIDTDAYLLNDLGVSYLYHCTQLLQRSGDNDLPNDFVGFGANFSNEYFQSLNYYADLPEIQRKADMLQLKSIGPLKKAVAEVKALCGMLDGKCYYEESVNKNTVGRALAQSRIVHFATHAMVDVDNMMKSGLLLYSDSMDIVSSLSYLDILKSRLENELVVLSACQSSFGKIYESEGVLSLARAFVHSGVFNVVGNMWNASDQATPRLMREFYHNLDNGYTTNEALRKAKLKYLNDSNNNPSIRAPHYWAGWKGYGTSVPFDQNRSSSTTYLFIFLGLVLIGYGLYSVLGSK